DRYQDGYRDGYRKGYDAGFYNNRGWRYNDGYRSNGFFASDNYRYGESPLRIARDFSYQDGSNVARQDAARGKPYDPYPRHNHEDRGYRREYGDKNAYRASYAAGYREGYEQAFRRY